MKYLTINPLRKLLENNERDYATKGDINQIENVIIKRIEQKKSNEKQKHSVFVDKKYLAVLKLLKKEFKVNKKITKKSLAEIVNKLLKDNNFDYISQIHETAYPNYFYDKNARKKDKNLNIYDMAFYNKKLKHNKKTHHHYTEKTFIPSAFYMRFEDYKNTDSMLIGNLQADVSTAHLFKKSHTAKILANPKNVNSMMVQQSIIHALQKNKKTIMFHTGDMAQIAQFKKRLISDTLVTDKNYKELLSEYHKEMNYFNKINYMDKINAHHEDCDHTSSIVYERTPEYYKITNTEKCMYNLLTMKVNGYQETVSGDIFSKLLDKDYEGFVEKYDLLLKENFNTDFNNFKEKVNFIKKGIANKYAGEWGEIVERFAVNFYGELFKRDDSRFLIVTKNNGENKYYIDKHSKSNITIKKKDIIFPVVGKRYPVPINAYSFSGYRHLSPVYKTYLFYEKKIPKILKSLGLSYEKTPIKSKSEYWLQAPHEAWCITGGLEKFAEKPIYCFAQHDKLKMDIESINDLQTAAAKFGISPNQLRVLNDWITTPTKDNYTGMYSQDNDQITLSTASLSLLAHEGLHRLQAKNLIPHKEYRAIVNAGKAIARNNKDMSDRLNKTNSTGQLIYPRGKSRDNEYAAIFVENYYENNQLARKKLMKQKIQNIEKALDYIKLARDVVLKKFGNQPAVARLFLRRVENNQFLNKTANTNNQSKTKNINHEEMVYA